ncbi:FCD domain-containing protein [Halodesulfovibrio marinisediminis]|uniref:FCD domain-containing protein n=1 Tax=Halodesulfovibrio marinisediminis TaxID=458711 RepID=UPI000A069BE0|nr:FCD domain-containing protein [Halodesulfovibrio marinisediminis]
MEESRGHDTVREMAERNEGSYLLLPIVAAQSAENIGVRLIDRLQQANIALSRSLLSGETTLIYDDVVSFFRILAQGTNNQYLVTVVEQLFSYSELLGTIITRLTQEERDRMFAQHVKLIHALRERDRGHAAEIVRRYILFYSYAAEKHCNVKATDLVFAAMQEFEGDLL